MASPADTDHNTTTVPAWLYTTTSYPSTLHLSQTTIPFTPPSPTHIIIAPHAVSLNPVDIQLMNLPFNDLPPSLPLLNLFTGPKIAGRDFSGTVLASGPSAPFSPGDPITGINMNVPGTGFLSRIVALDIGASSSATVIKKPAHLSHLQAASLPCVYLTARTSISRCEPYCTLLPAEHNKVVVLGGSSTTGIYSIRLAKRRGWTVLASCSSRNADFVRGLGADEVVDYTASPSAVVDAVRAFNAHAIVDCVGGTECIGLAGQYVTIVGDKTGRRTMGGSALYLTRPRMVWRWLMGWLGLGARYECIVLEPREEWLKEVEGLKGEDVIVDSMFPWENVREAFERLDTGRARGKVVVRVVEGEEEEK